MHEKHDGTDLVDDEQLRAEVGAIEVPCVLLPGGASLQDQVAGHCVHSQPSPLGSSMTCTTCCMRCCWQVEGAR